MHRCPFCKTDVEDLGSHYGGFLVPPCPDVARAFGPDAPGRTVPKRRRLTDDELRVRRADGVRRRRQTARRRASLIQEGIPQ